MEMRNEFLRKLKTSFHFQISRRDLTISDVAHAQQSESELSLPSLNRNIVPQKRRKKLQSLREKIATLKGNKKTNAFFLSIVSLPA